MRDTQSSPTRTDPVGLLCGFELENANYRANYTIAPHYFYKNP